MDIMVARGSTFCVLCRRQGVMELFVLGETVRVIA